MTSNNSEKQISRSPVVAVIGHIDHGKSTLLDYFRKTKVAEKEAGGITQHIAAYEVEIEVSGEKRRITFLDTPGHEAFNAMRARGSRIADIVLLVVSAEDGVKPQTVEAIRFIREANTPFIVVLNKIDKPNANTDKTKQDLAENEVFVEGWGGTVPVVATSAKTGQGTDELLELILLQADILGLKGDTTIPAEGFIIESSRDARKGVSATLIIKNGVLSKGLFIGAKGAFVPVRSIEYFDGSQLNEAKFSSPVRITGWSDVPTVGEAFKTFKDKREAEAFAMVSSTDNVKHEPANESEGKSFPLVLKADALGSVEAIANELAKLANERIKVRLIAQGIGAITEGDVKFAISSKAVIAGFNSLPDKSAAALAMRDNVEIKTFSIIYELIDWVRARLDELVPLEQAPSVIGKAKILKVFSKNRDKQVVGGKVEEGELKTGIQVNIYRRDNLIGDGRIRELQSQRVKTSSVTEGNEFGTMIESKTEIAGGDTIEAIFAS